MSNSIKIIHAEEILLSISEHFLIGNLSMYNASLSLSFFKIDLQVSML